MLDELCRRVISWLPDNLRLESVSTATYILAAGYGPRVAESSTPHAPWLDAAGYYPDWLIGPKPLRPAQTVSELAASALFTAFLSFLILRAEAVDGRLSKDQAHALDRLIQCGQRKAASFTLRALEASNPGDKAIDTLRIAIAHMPTEAEILLGMGKEARG